MVMAGTTIKGWGGIAQLTQAKTFKKCVSLGFNLPRQKEQVQTLGVGPHPEKKSSTKKAEVEGTLIS